MRFNPDTDMHNVHNVHSIPNRVLASLALHFGHDAGRLNRIVVTLHHLPNAVLEMKDTAGPISLAAITWLAREHNDRIRSERPHAHPQDRGRSD